MVYLEKMDWRIFGTVCAYCAILVVPQRNNTRRGAPSHISSRTCQKKQSWRGRDEQCIAGFPSFHGVDSRRKFSPVRDLRSMLLFSIAL
jgi:hypothetical protein